MGELSIYNPDKDPSQLGYPPTLPIEIALKTAPLSDIREEYGFTKDEWLALRYNPNFISDLAAATEMLKIEGMSFKLKARLQAEELLKTSWKMIHAPKDDVAPAVRADLIKSTMRWAGFDNKDNAATNANQLNIQINLGEA